MMGRSHALVGATFGVAFAGVLGDAPLMVRLLVIPVTGGAALLPDLDHPSSRFARSLWFITVWLAKSISAVSLAVYHATRTDRDVVNRKSGHRAMTHTLVGCVGFGAIAVVVTLAHPLAGTILVGLLAGLLALGFKSIGIGFTAAGTIAGWVTLTHYPGWWWTVPVAVTLGATVHLVAGDYLTNSGVPLLWPLLIDGRRWTLLRAPATFSTGSHVESNVITPMLFVALAVSAAFSSGAAPLLIHTWVQHA